MENIRNIKQKINQLKIPDNCKILNSTHLKIIAIVSMLIDHFAKGFIYLGYLQSHSPIKKGSFEYEILQFYHVLRGIGRIAFPIFCFLLIEGFLHTKNRKKYLLRLFIFAFISEIPFDLTLYNKLCIWKSQNVFFTLFLGLLMLCIIDWIQSKDKDRISAIGFQIATIAIIMYIAKVIHSDYDFKGILLILVFYLLRFNNILECIGGAIAISWEFPYVLLAFPPLFLYNGKKGKQRKYFFYVFYPAHLILIYLIRIIFFTK